MVPTIELLKKKRQIEAISSDLDLLANKSTLRFSLWHLNLLDTCYFQKVCTSKTKSWQ